MERYRLMKRLPAPTFGVFTTICCTCAPVCRANIAFNSHCVCPAYALRVSAQQVLVLCLLGAAMLQGPLIVIR